MRKMRKLAIMGITSTMAFGPAATVITAVNTPVFAATRPYSVKLGDTKFEGSYIKLSEALGDKNVRSITIKADSPDLADCLDIDGKPFNVLEGVSVDLGGESVSPTSVTLAKNAKLKNLELSTGPVELGVGASLTDVKKNSSLGGVTLGENATLSGVNKETEITVGQIILNKGSSVKTAKFTGSDLWVKGSATGVKIENVKFTASGSQALGIDPSASVTVSNSTLNGTNGIVVGINATAKLTGVTVEASNIGIQVNNNGTLEDTNGSIIKCATGIDYRTTTENTRTTVKLNGTTIGQNVADSTSNKGVTVGILKGSNAFGGGNLSVTNSHIYADDANGTGIKIPFYDDSVFLNNTEITVSGSTIRGKIGVEVENVAGTISNTTITAFKNSIVSEATIVGNPAKKVQLLVNKGTYFGPVDATTPKEDQSKELVISLVEGTFYKDRVNLTPVDELLPYLNDNSACDSKGVIAPKGGSSNGGTTTNPKPEVKPEQTAGHWDQTSNGDWIYLDKNGKRVYGWQTIGSNTYYFSEKTGIMQTGWLELGNKTYYLKSGGEMVTGSYKVNNKDYLFNTNGEMQTGVCKAPDGKIYEYASNGARVSNKGWKTIDGKEYYFLADGAAATGKQNLGGKEYNFDSNGVLIKDNTSKPEQKPETGSGLITEGGNTYYVVNGEKAKGWQKLPSSTNNAGWHYFDSKTGAMQTGWLKHDGDYYYLNTNNGKMVEGWDQIAGSWYYFVPGNGNMVKGWKKLNWDGGPKWFYFHDDGHMQGAGVEYIDGEYYYFYGDGTMAGARSHSNDVIMIDGLRIDSAGKILNPEVLFQGPNAAVTYS